MRGVVIFLGFLVLIAGAAVAGAQFAPPSLDLSFLASIPGAQDFLKTPTALYAGGGAAAFGLLLMIIGMATGGKKSKTKEPKKKAAKAAPEPAREAKRAAAPEANSHQKPVAQPAPAPVAAKKVAPQLAIPPTAQPKPVSQPAPAPAPVAAKKAAPQLVIPPTPQRAAQPAAPKPEARPPTPAPSAKPQASATPPPSAKAASAPPPSASAAKVEDTGPTWSQDPRFTNRKRVSDLVTINDALKAYRAKNGAYPKAEGLQGFPDRGKAWIPGLSPDFIADLPRDPVQSNDRNGPQYLYASNGTDYKLLAHGVALAGGTNVEVLGVRVDPSKQNTMEKAAFGFWTDGFASV